MEVAIRTFQNTDLPAMCEIWNAHHADHAMSKHGMNVGIDTDRMELFCQSKVYFDPEQLLIGSMDGNPYGFLHLSPVPNDLLDEAHTNQLGVAALCVRPCSHQDRVASALLEAARKVCTAAGIQRLVFRPSLPLCSFYLGIGPADSLAGTLSSEENVFRWISHAGYKPAVPTSMWELDLDRFRVPGDRIQILVRRRSLVDRQLQEPNLPWWQSCVLGHTEVTAFRLFDRVQKRALQEIVLWGLSPSLSSWPEKIMWLWPPKMDYLPEDSPVEISPVDRLVFLLAEALRDLHTERVESLRTVTHAEANEMHQVLHRLGFNAVESGMVFELRLSPGI